MNTLIATHNSATGEKSGSLLSVLLIPFARCQNKTIKEQYNLGCRMFDIRIKYIKKSWRCSHGLWYTKRTALNILEEINSFNEPCYVCITYEGKISSTQENDEFIYFCNTMKKMFTNIKWGEICAKYADDDVKVDWTCLQKSEDWHEARQGFLPLDGKHWQTYFPIPWLWNKIYTNKHEFNESIFTFVDFL